MSVRNSIVVFLTNITSVPIYTELWFFNTMCICNWGRGPMWNFVDRLPVFADKSWFSVPWLLNNCMHGSIYYKGAHFKTQNMTKYVILEKNLISQLLTSIKYILWREIKGVCSTVYDICLNKVPRETITYFTRNLSCLFLLFLDLQILLIIGC